MSNSIAAALVRLMFQLVLLPLVVLMIPLAFSLAWVREALLDLMRPRVAPRLAPVRVVLPTQERSRLRC